ncbi:MAG TPA: hypothetical protein VE076_04255 [Nitrososphaeraceae archaeon]|nr:hypothetical protein [Nitrososphaeraceae archaeon]
MIYTFETFAMDKKISEVNSRHEEEREDQLEEVREDNIEAAKKQQQQQKPKSKEDVVESINSSDQKWPAT